MKPELFTMFEIEDRIRAGEMFEFHMYGSRIKQIRMMRDEEGEFIASRDNISGIFSCWCIVAQCDPFEQIYAPVHYPSPERELGDFERQIESRAKDRAKHKYKALLEFHERVAAGDEDVNNIEAPFKNSKESDRILAILRRELLEQMK